MITTTLALPPGHQSRLRTIIRTKHPILRIRVDVDHKSSHPGWCPHGPTHTPAHGADPQKDTIYQPSRRHVGVAQRATNGAEHSVEFPLRRPLYDSDPWSKMPGRECAGPWPQPYSAHNLRLRRHRCRRTQRTCIHPCLRSFSWATHRAQRRIRRVLGGPRCRIRSSRSLIVIVYPDEQNTTQGHSVDSP
ncbi:hypothetical protein BV20DRAFT_376028 [Pilatotrama ljubarskyi]|nr:hypothetical protein BV20DRAFT_376028 [Pilatotrama ljubarskyi]